MTELTNNDGDYVDIFGGAVGGLRGRPQQTHHTEGLRPTDKTRVFFVPGRGKDEATC